MHHLVELRRLIVFFARGEDSLQSHLVSLEPSDEEPLPSVYRLLKQRCVSSSVDYKSLI